MKRYEIAGLQVEMDVTGRTLQQAAAYAAEPCGPADVVIQCDPAQVLRQMPVMGSLEMAEYMATGRRFALSLLRYNGFQLHSSAVLLEGKAYLFSAPSGTGKSTHTEKWQRLFGAQYINDDKPVLRRLDAGWMAYGTPWSGKYDLSKPISARLGGIAFLERGAENQIRRMTPVEAVPLLLSQSLRHLNAEQMDRQLALMDRLLTEVPVWLLTCRNDDEAAYLSHGEMVR